MLFKKLIRALFPRLVNLRNRVHNYLVHYRFKNLPADEVFEIIHNENHWSDNESLSGTGSNIRNTEQVVKIVSSVINELRVKLILDIPCGDFNWMKEVNLKGVDYLGADIVTDLVLKNSEKYSSETVRFSKLNILQSPLPRVDLLFCRDCLVHFSYRDIYKAIDSVRNSRSAYFMTTTFPNHRNHDIITGDWRPINLESAPFNFPPPVYIYDELCSEDERYSDKSLAVWRVGDL